ncbi:MAG TPA: sugar transferase [Candidatus Sumerlaeota bacterium]|nr:sugar transferase [Candidatus Sumerlaeota bacterium]HPS00373.1 sugar transferase [Candidatus Sumerlaeota bacterium]
MRSKPVGKCVNLFGKTVQEVNLKDLHSPKTFQSLLAKECARADRNGHGFSVVDFNLEHRADDRKFLEHFVSILMERTRMTDEIGWLDTQNLGLMLFNAEAQQADGFARKILSTDIQGISLTYNVYSYPKGWLGGGKDKRKPENDRDKTSVIQQSGTNEKSDEGVSPQLCARTVPSLKERVFPSSLPVWKRMIDILGAGIGLALLSPFFLLVGLFIRLVSPGSPIFKQERVGYLGKSFTLWKFRTMHINVDTSKHRNLLASMIHSTDENGMPMTKMENTPEIIRFGGLLRKSCIDELPQLVNVLRGEMSLVGPRPPIPYESEEYLLWHNGRFDAVPGMTGLWQVSGKNRLTFNEMARLDIQYSREMSFWLDLEILLRTPLAIFDQIGDTLRDQNQQQIPEDAPENA